jgi:hypothetical protein
MRHVLEAIEKKTDAFAALPLYAFMRDTSIDPRQRLPFVPALAHFVMSFADLYGLILREEPARDKYQEIVNAHTYEDGGHWKWFLADLEKLGYDPQLPFSDALRFLWSDATVQIRMLSYRMCQLGLGADSLHKLVLVHCIEATGKVSLEHSAMIARELTLSSRKPLVYFGAHHVDTEADHTLEDEGVHAMLADITLAPELSRELVTLVDSSFAAFTAFADELLAFAKSGLRISPG